MAEEKYMTAMDLLTGYQTDWQGKPVTSTAGNPSLDLSKPLPFLSNPNLGIYQPGSHMISRSAYTKRGLTMADVRNFMAQDPFNPTVPTPAGSSLPSYLTSNPSLLSWLTGAINTGLSSYLSRYTNPTSRYYN